LTPTLVNLIETALSTPASGDDALSCASEALVVLSEFRHPELVSNVLLREITGTALNPSNEYVSELADAMLICGRLGWHTDRAAALEIHLLKQCRSFIDVSEMVGAAIASQLLNSACALVPRLSGAQREAFKATVPIIELALGVTEPAVVPQTFCVFAKPVNTVFAELKALLA
jgi:hypothetical protein